MIDIEKLKKSITQPGHSPDTAAVSVQLVIAEQTARLADAQERTATAMVKIVKMLENSSLINYK